MHSEGGFVKTIRDSILILIFEFIGTLLLTLLYHCFTFYTSYTNGNGYVVHDFTGFLLGVFILLIFGAKISGSHYNPCVTLAFMLRRDTGKFSRSLGLAYIIFQVGGAFCGSLIGFMFTAYGGNLQLSGSETIGQGIVSETLGSFFLVFLYLTQTEENTKLSKDPAITTLIIAASYLAALLMTSPPDVAFSCLNPAIGISTTLVMTFDGENKANGIQWIWVYALFPLVGGVIAVIFHEFIYRKVTTAIVEIEEQQEAEEGEYDDRANNRENEVPL